MALEVVATWRGGLATDVQARGHAIRVDEPVTAGGTVYYVRSGYSCGEHTKIVQVTDDGATKQTIYSFPDGVDASDLFAYPNESKTVDLYLSRVPCRTFDFDVYVMSGV